MNKPLLLSVFLGALVGCSDEGEGEVKVDEHPATSSFSESTKPKKISSKPCSDYNLKFYEGDEREFDQTTIRLGDSRSDAEVEINGRKLAILGFEGQAEEYINYSVYRGNLYSKEDQNGTTLSTRVETQITVCFRKDVIAVKQLTEKIRARGDLSKVQYFNKQWIWKVDS